VEAGYEIHKDVFSREEMRVLADALDRQSFERTRAGARHLMQIDEVRRIAADARLIGIASGVVGGTAQAYRTTLFDKSAEANWLVAWHQDTTLPMVARREVAGFTGWSQKQGVWYAQAPAAVLERVVALRIHIDDSTEFNGPLRVIPGTHRDGVLTEEQVSARATKSPSVVCLADSGGVVAVRPLIIHASSKARAAGSRRVLHIEYGTTLDIGGGLQLRVV
jgi:ectoine hydroxylase-related dioxygenase (phytanoyl-CoA dioxygenase family)